MDKKKGRIAMRKTLLTMLSVVVILGLVACGDGKVDDSTKEKYITHAEEIVSLLNESKYDDIRAEFDDQMKAELSVDQMEELSPIIEQSGTFEAIDKSSVEEKDGLYTTVLVAKYSKENRVFTITFNESDEIAGLYIK